MNSTPEQKEVSYTNFSLPIDRPYPPLPKDKNKQFKWLEQGFLILSLLIIFLIFGYHCPIYQISHIHCPGCGMTRAALALMQGDLNASLSWHALLLPTIGLISLYFLTNRKFYKSAQTLLWVWILLMMIYWIYRLIFVFPNVAW